MFLQLVLLALFLIGAWYLNVKFIQIPVVDWLNKLGHYVRDGFGSIGIRLPTWNIETTNAFRNFRISFQSLRMGALLPSKSNPISIRRRIILLGDTGKGKSSTAKSILGNEAFKANKVEDHATRCKKISKSRFQYDLDVVDTPGALMGSDFIAFVTQLFDCIRLCNPGPHAFVIVVDKSSLSIGEQNAFKLFRSILNDSFLQHSIVLFTGYDEMVKENITPEILIANNKPLRDVVESCGSRFIAFDNKAEGLQNEVQVKHLLSKIGDMTKGGRTYLHGKAWKVHENVFREKADIFDKELDAEEQCKIYLQEVEKEKKRLDKEEWKRFVIQCFVAIIITIVAGAFNGISGTATALLAALGIVVVKEILKMRKSERPKYFVQILACAFVSMGALAVGGLVSALSACLAYLGGAILSVMKPE